MTAKKELSLAPGLYFVATPIGSARDITLRALDLLTSCDVLAAEDTRSLRKLMDIHGVDLAGRPLLAYHDHNGPAQRPKILAALEADKTVLYASEAGTPLIADPGFQLARAAIEAGYPLHTAPGASAVLAGLTVSGLPTDRFFFAGFAPNAKGARRAYLQELKAVPGTLVFYESPKRVNRILEDMCEVLGDTRQAVVARELTKKFEEVMRGTLRDLRDEISQRSLKGEVVIMVDRPDPLELDEQTMETMLRTALATQSTKDAVAEIASISGMPRRKVYQMALRIENDDEP